MSEIPAPHFHRHQTPLPGMARQPAPHPADSFREASRLLSFGLGLASLCFRPLLYLEFWTTGDSQVASERPHQHGMRVNFFCIVRRSLAPPMVQDPRPNFQLWSSSVVWGVWLLGGGVFTSRGVGCLACGLLSLLLLLLDQTSENRGPQPHQSKVGVRFRARPQGLSGTWQGLGRV